jgi:hypothetical protein
LILISKDVHDFIHHNDVKYENAKNRNQYLAYLREDYIGNIIEETIEQSHIDGLNYFRLDDKGNVLRMLYDKGYLKELIFIPSDKEESLSIIKHISKIK